MYHPEKGKTTLQLWAEERAGGQGECSIVPPHLLEKIKEERLRHAELARVAAALCALAEDRVRDYADQDTMISEGGPVDTNEQGEVI